MLEMARAWLILPPSGWDFPDPEAMEPTPSESQVVSFVPFHLVGLVGLCASLRAKVPLLFQVAAS
jgi:hypothetical protein